MTEVKIYQLKEDAPGKFFGSKMPGNAIEEGNKVQRELYRNVYICRREDNVDLEDLFYEFNMEIPNDFHGHSLSVSDIVSLDGKLYFVDSIGFKEVTWIRKAA